MIVSRIPPPLGNAPPVLDGASPWVLMILQVSPLPGLSLLEEFFYDPFADVTVGDFVAV
jgi:hypothetical protein